jgi:hypothetical protein
MEKVQSLLDTASGVLGFGGDPFATLVGSKVSLHVLRKGPLTRKMFMRLRQSEHQIDLKDEPKIHVLSFLTVPL